MAVRQGHGAWRSPSNSGLLTPLEKFFRVAFRAQARAIRRTAYTGEELRKLRAERGVERPPHIIKKREARHG